METSKKDHNCYFCIHSFHTSNLSGWLKWECKKTGEVVSYKDDIDPPNNCIMFERNENIMRN
jgi:hypothetical protein